MLCQNTFNVADELSDCKHNTLIFVLLFNINENQQYSFFFLQYNSVLDGKLIYQNK